MEKKTCHIFISLFLIQGRGWYGLKRDVATHVAMCDVCQRVKAEHQRPARQLHPLKIPEWEWEEIDMDFITGLPHTQKGYCNTSGVTVTKT